MSEEVSKSVLPGTGCGCPGCGCLTVIVFALTAFVLGIIFSDELKEYMKENYDAYSNQLKEKIEHFIEELDL